MPDPHKLVPVRTTAFVPITVLRRESSERSRDLTVYKDGQGGVLLTYYEMGLIMCPGFLSSNHAGSFTNEKIEGEGAFKVEGLNVGFKLKTGHSEIDLIYNTWYISKGYKITMDLMPDGYFVARSISEDSRASQVKMLKKMVFNPDGSVSEFKGEIDTSEIIGKECFIANSQLNVLLSNDASAITSLFDKTFTIQVEFNLPEKKMMSSKK